MVLDALPDALPLLLVLAGVILMGLEALAPGANFIVVGVALLGAGIGGVVLSSVLGGTALVLALAAMVFLFGALSLYVYREFEFYEGEGGVDKTPDSSSLRGQTGRVVDRVTESSGRVKLDEGGFNPMYQARSVVGEIPEGEEVIVVDPGGGNVVTVESLAGLEPDSIDRALAEDREREESTE